MRPVTVGAIMAPSWYGGGHVTGFVGVEYGVRGCRLEVFDPGSRRRDRESPRALRYGRGGSFTVFTRIVAPVVVEGPHSVVPAGGRRPGQKRVPVGVPWYRGTMSGPGWRFD